ncbi:hypothetical protein POM88_051644 [Heracleum sosnowskyi]|uniref:Uncharacterized protein n=1 Tax=Heracleum sosnowskyi TaxID=360622 RepID=A0AAD8H110_9APIA|nr:hypothetical protein POM88_051644 [Heracleum sosnowskyi]
MISGSSSSLTSLSSTRSCSCNCQNTSPFIQINIGFPQLSVSPTIEMIAHVYSILHPLFDQLMMSLQDGSLLLFQVAVSDKGHTLRRKLNNIAKKADTSTLDGLNYELKEAVKALRQCNDSCIHFTKLHKRYDSMKSLSKCFEEFLSQELETHGEGENTLVNVDNNVTYRNKARMVRANRRNNNGYTVVTLLVLATGKHLIPYFKENGTRYHHVSEVLQTLQCIAKNEIQSVKVLWSPRKEYEVLLEDQLRIDFPRLNPRILL